MMKKPGNNYESPFIKLLQFDVNDIVTTSTGNNFYEWDWSEDEPYDDGLFN